MKAEKELTLNYYDYITSRRGYEFYRRTFKCGGRKAKWKAKTPTGKIINVTYDQALGYEPIDNGEALGMYLGRILGIGK